MSAAAADRFNATSLTHYGATARPPSPLPAAGQAEHEAGCRVPGCRKAPAGPYFQKYRICRQHYSAAILDMGRGELHRFCQQCSRTHTLREFDGGKLSCRAGLARHTQRRKERMQRQADEPRKRCRRAAGEGGAAVAGAPQRSPRRLALERQQWAHTVGGQLQLQLPAPPLACGALPESLSALAYLDPPRPHAMLTQRAPRLPAPAPALVLPPAPLAAQLLGPAGAGSSLEAAPLPPASLGPLTPTPSEDPPCLPAAPALPYPGMLIRAALLREQVHCLLQALQHRPGPAQSLQPAVQQPDTPSVGAGMGSCAFNPSISAGAGPVQLAAPAPAVPGASRRSAFRPWKAARQHCGPAAVMAGQFRS
ncbi:hypothetical protein ABPG75_006741 [Micractinium tetrahymenae]